MSFSLDTIVQASADQATADLGDTIAVMQQRTGLYFGLEGVGAQIWQLIATPIRVADLRDALVELYDVDSERCERDVFEFLGELADLGLVDVRDR